MSQFQLFPPPDHPHYRLLVELAKDLDRDARDLAVQQPKKQTIDDWCERNQIDLNSLQSVAEAGVTEMLMNLVIMPAVNGTRPPADEAITQAMVNFILAFELGYAFALNRPDLP